MKCTKKMKFTRKMITMIVIILLYLSLAISVYANCSFNISAFANNTQLKSGQEVVLTVAVKDLKEINKGLNAFKATIEYDKTVFKEINEGNFNLQNNWTNLKFNSKNGQFVVIKKNGTTQDEDVIKIKMFVKDNAKAGHSNIIIKNTVASEGKEDIFGNEQEIKVEVFRPDVEVFSNNIQTKNEEIKKNSDLNEKDNQMGEANRKLPKTGISYVARYIWIINIILIIIAIRSYKKYNQITKKINKKIFTFIFVFLISGQFVTTIYAVIIPFYEKGELSGDKLIDYVDVNFIEEHIIEENQIKSELFRNADMNNDGKITVTDLSLIVRKIEKSLEYIVTIVDSDSQNVYVKKGEEINLYFLAAVSYDEEIKEVTINKKNYTVEKINQDGLMAEYKVIIPKEQTSGVKEYTFNEVLLKNDKKVNVDYANKIDILKEKPAINNYVLTEDAENSKLKIEFSIEDNDKSITEARYEILDLNQNRIKENSLVIGKNKITIDAKEDEIYNVNIYVNYNLDSDSLQIEKDNSGVIQENKQVKLIVDYKFVLNNIKTYKDGNENTIYSKEEGIQLKFNSSNISIFYPEKIKINGKYYTITKNATDFETFIDGFTDIGNKTITIEEVILNNGKVFSLNENINVEIIKRKPNVSEFKYNENIETSKLNVQFKLEDIDNSLKSSKVILLDESNKQISESIITGNDINIDLDTSVTNQYTVKVMTDYSLEENGSVHTYNDEVIYEDVITAKPVVKIKNASVSKLYPNKNEQINIIYNIETNKKQEIKEIIVNSIIFPVTKLGNGDYQITYTAQKAAGIEELITSKIIFNDETETNVSNKLKIDILKEVPSIVNYNIEDIVSEGKVKITFDVVDKEDSFIAGKVQLVKRDDNTKLEQTIEVGSNIIEFSVEEKKMYDLHVLVDYDLDTNSLDNQAQELNRIQQEKIYSKEVQQVIDYKLTTSNVKTYKNSKETIYFQKNEPIELRFNSENATKFYPINAVISGKEYTLVKNNNIYTVQLDALEQAGKKEIVIEKIILNNYKELTIQSDNSVNIEIIKSKPTVQNFLYKETADAKLDMSLELIDIDDSTTKAEVIVLGQNGLEILRKDLNIGDNQFFVSMDVNEIYTVNVIVDYDLDTNELESGQNEYKNQELLNKKISFEDRLIELKDIQKVNLYKKNGEQVELLSNVSIEDLADLDNYIVEIEMKDAPSVYTTLKDYKIENNNLKFILEYENVVQYEGNESRNELIVDYGQISNNIAMNGSIEALIRAIEANPKGKFELTQDLNADIITSGDTLIDSNIVFKGTLNGNGYKIYNLNKPLFNSTSGATIKDLIITDSSISSVGRGLIANEATNVTTLTNVHANNISITANSAETGTLIGTTKSSTMIRNCSVQNVTITSSSKRIGGIIGGMANTLLSNCYVIGKMSSSQDSIGGITGFAQNITISETYVDIEFNTTSGPGYNGGFVGQGTGAKILNSLSLATGQKANRFVGYGGFNTGSTNNYEISTSTLNSNAGAGGVSVVEKSKLQEEDFYKNRLKLDDTIWDYSKVAQDEMPTLRNDDPNYELNKELKPSNSKLYIPYYTRLKSINGYDESKEIAYHNLYKLMPYYDAKYIVIDGTKIDKEHVLNKKLIKHIMPIDENNNLVLYLTNKNYQNIKKIKIIYEDNTTQTYTVTYKNYYGNVASYTIDKLNIFYNFNRYVLKEDASIFDTLKEYIKALDYTVDLDSLTVDEDSRLYKDHFGQKVISEADEFIFKLLENSSNYIVTLENEVLNKKIQKELITDGKLKEIIYAYNYYKRWYDIEIGEVDVHDVIMFNGELFNNTMTLNTMVDEVLTGNRATDATQNFYANNISKYTGYSKIENFLDYIITTIGEYQDVNDWFTQNYQGIVHEVNIDNRPDIEYRAWQQLKKRNNFLLPFLTLPKNSAYIVSSPTQFLVGAQRTYIADPTNATQKAQLIEKITNYGKLIKNFYTTTAGFIEKEHLNPHADIQIDHRYTKNSSGVSEYQSQGTTEEPFHKNFNEAVNCWAAANGSAAYATGSNVYWVASTALSSFSTWSHESGHNQDSKVFLKGNGRRPQGWAEDYADGNTTQDFGDGAFNFNLSETHSIDSSITTNLTPERINTTDKINSYYREMFKASDFLDYIEAKAFLSLTPAEQAKVAVQIFYPNKEQGTDEEKEAGDEVTGWRLLTEDQIKAMNLTTVEDLWDNKITIKPGITGQTSIGTNRYGADSIYTRHWYQQHNDNGRPDSYAFKQLAWEMLGFAGYDNGYLIYYSGKSKTDLDAIRQITNNPDMTWKQYKMQRYQDMETQWNNMKYINPDEVLEQYKQALKIDAEKNDRNITASTNIKRINYHYLKRITNDFETDIFTTQINAIHIKTAQQLQEQITNNPNQYFVLDNDIDVSTLTGTTSIINNTFVGKLDGQGNKITGNTLPLFEKLKFAQISNLIIEESNIQLNDSHAGALARIMENSKLKNIHVVNANVQGASRVGAIIGYVTNSVTEECSSNATIIATGNAIGGLIGEYNTSMITNCYSLGSVKGKQDVGGFIGWADNSFIKNSYSAANVESTANVAGGFIGQAKGTTRIKNNISFASVTNGYKFDGRTANAMFAQYKNNYEYKDTKGTSSLDRSEIDFSGKISLLKDTQAITEDFYKNTIKWSSNIWDYTNISIGGLPKLKNFDPNNVTQIVEKIKISSLEEFLKIDEAPDKIYVLTQNIDFSTSTENDAIIKQIFTGKIDGNGYTLSNLTNATLFSDFRGTAENLKLSNFQNVKPSENFVTAFAKQTYGSTIKNIEIENVTLSGMHNVAVLTGMDGREGANSIFEKITVKNANVTGTGVYVSAFVGRKYGGKIKDCYVEGNVTCYKTENAGIVGATHQNIQVENIISNVNINRPSSTDDRNQNGGFIGNMYNAPTIKNCISLGNMTGFTDENTNEINVNKFTGATEEFIIARLENCYEVKEKTGVTSVNANTSSHLDEVEESTVKTTDFYKDTLKFDESIWNFDTVTSLGYPLLKH